MAFCDLWHTYHKQVTNVSPAWFCHPTVGNFDVSPNIHANIYFSFAGYVEKKKDISSQWAALQNHLIAQLVESAYPRSFDCCRCQVPLGNCSESLLRCLDCGPRAYYCEDCFTHYHSVITLHQPQVWDTDVSIYTGCEISTGPGTNASGILVGPVKNWCIYLLNL